MSGSYNNQRWTQAAGPPPSAGMYVQPVMQPAIPEQFRAPQDPYAPQDYAPAPALPADLQQQVFAALCKAAACCTQLSEPVPTAHPDFSGRVEDVEGSIVIAAAGLGSTAAAIVSAGILAASNGLTTGQGTTTVATFQVPPGKAAVVRAWDAKVLHGDPTAVTFSVRATGMNGIYRALARSPRGALRRPDDLSAFLILAQNETVTLSAETASTLSPYLVTGRMSIWTWQPQVIGRVSSLDGLVNKAGRGNKLPGCQ